MCVCVSVPFRQLARCVCMLRANCLVIHSPKSLFSISLLHEIYTWQVKLVNTFHGKKYLKRAPQGITESNAQFFLPKKREKNWLQIFLLIFLERK